MTAGTTVQAPDGTEVVLGEIGTRVLLENSRTPDVTYLQPGDSYELPVKQSRTNGFNIVDSATTAEL